VIASERSERSTLSITGGIATLRYDLITFALLRMPGYEIIIIVLCKIEGPVLSKIEGPVLSEIEGPVLSEIEGSVLSEIEGSVLSEIEGPVLSEIEGEGFWERTQ